MKRSIFFLILLFANFFAIGQASDFIHVDQFGYESDAPKVAVVSSPLIGYNSHLGFSPSNTMEVREYFSDSVVFSAVPLIWSNGATDPLAGDFGWWFDFSSLTTPGTYYVRDGMWMEASAPFEIKADPYSEVLKAAGRMFYYNRCNMEKAQPYADANWVDGNNFLNNFQDGNARYIYDSTNTALNRDMSGGWFDAGDYNKYVTYTYTTLHDLLSAYESNPRAFGDNWNIPESGNGIPDLLDEVKWELDWLLKMSNPDGSVHIKIGSRNYAENTSSPPSANTDGRYYGPTCTSASATVASVMSHAALVFDGQPGMQTYAQQLGQMATTAFQYTLPFYQNGTLETGCDDGSIVSGDADQPVSEQLNQLVTAAVYLFAWNNSATAHQFLRDHYDDTETVRDDVWNHYYTPLIDALLWYANQPNADQLVANDIWTKVTQAVNNNYEDLFGFDDRDLYRAYMPDYSYHWGSSKPKASLGNLNLTMAAYGVGNDSLSQLLKAEEQLHYFHGVNPLGIVYLSNMYSLGAERSVNEIYHSWFWDGTDWDHAQNSLYGPAPGYVTGGPNSGYAIASNSPPYGQPAMKSYLDFNDGFPNESYSISEPAIYYQAAYIRLLSFFGNSNLTTGIVDQEQNLNIRIMPNPTHQYITYEGNEASLEMIVYSMDGREVGRAYLEFPGERMDVSYLSSGTYVVRGLNQEAGINYYQKIIRQ